jgi:hypothetical protein
MGSGVFREEGNIDTFDPSPSYLLLPPNPLAYHHSPPVPTLLTGAQSYVGINRRLLPSALTGIDRRLNHL